MLLDSFWHAAASLAGRVDLVPVRSLLADGPPCAHDLAAAGLPPDHVARLTNGRPRDLAHPFLTLADDRYPAALMQAPFAPPVLFLRGDATLLRAPAVALVGSRACTATGRRLAGQLAAQVVAAGGVVVSGLAHGIDHAAHEASLARTIAVLGQGLAAPLSQRQRDLADRIVAAGGLVLSELLPEHPAHRWTFPQRNRIIAGLSRATVVVEAARRSGALITAREALALGRDVLAVPGSPLAPASQGCLDLIADGATIVRQPSDVRALLPDRVGPPQVAAGPALPATLDRALAQGADLDRLALVTGWPLPELTRTLSALELQGLVERLPGDRFAYPARRG